MQPGCCDNNLKRSPVYKIGSYAHRHLVTTNTELKWMWLPLLFRDVIARDFIACYQHMQPVFGQLFLSLINSDVIFGLI